MSGQWSAETALEWGKKQRWMTGCNFILSTAINQIDMWQASTWDPATIDQELGFAQSIGMGVVRVYLHDLVYESDPAGMLQRMNQFLVMATSRGITTLFVIFDDCWNPAAELGPQHAPKPSVHNSGWVKSPQLSQRTWPTDLDRLENYVKALFREFGSDSRVWMWDLFNEPANGSGVLLGKVFEWAWAARPSQPLTVCDWDASNQLRLKAIERSDVVSFHNYGTPDKVREQVEFLNSFGRPVICTEWLARTTASIPQTVLPVFKELGITCINWGLVRGKTNTIFPWGTEEGAPEPPRWFHDLFWPDGTPYDPEEAAAFKSLAS